MPIASKIAPSNAPKPDPPAPEPPKEPKKRRTNRGRRAKPDANASPTYVADIAKTDVTIDFS
jgi:hypothetical protein